MIRCGRTAERSALVCLALALALAACAAPAQPRRKPIPMSAVDTSAGSVEAVRRQLEGTWELVSAEVYPEPGKVVPVEATGRLTFDAYGNVRTDATLAEPSADASRLLSYSGNVVIDPRKKEWRLTDVTAEEGAPPEKALPNEVGPDKIRAYEFVGDELKLLMKDETGRATGSATWRRAR
jgi:hypothetical protein